jgi:putative chitinase
MNTSNLATKLPKAASSYMLQVVDKYDIKNPLHLAHFLAQIAHESGNFQFVTENLNYSAEGLRKVFPKYFADNIIAMKYARNNEAIGSRVYANRMGNGDEASKDGFKFRGRGYIQLTGKSNYKDFSDFIKEDCVANPDLVATKYPMDSAIWFFDKNKLWDICAKGSGDDTVTAVTKRVNGGTHGLADRIAKFKLYYSLLQQA